MRFFRVQGKGHTFEEMKEFISQRGDIEDDSEATGICVSASPDGIDGGSRFGGAWDAMDDDDDLVVLEGRIIEKLYDGYIIIPEREVARFTIAQWSEMLESGTAWNYE